MRSGTSTARSAPVTASSTGPRSASAPPNTFGRRLWTDRVHPADRDRGRLAPGCARGHACLDRGVSFPPVRRRIVYIFDRGQIIRDAEGGSARRGRDDGHHCAQARGGDGRCRRRSSRLRMTRSSARRSTAPSAHGMQAPSGCSGTRPPRPSDDRSRLIVPPRKLAEEARILATRPRRAHQHFETRVAKDGHESTSPDRFAVTDANGRIFGASKVAATSGAQAGRARICAVRELSCRLLWESASVLLTTQNPRRCCAAFSRRSRRTSAWTRYLNFMVMEEQ